MFRKSLLSQITGKFSFPHACRTMNPSLSLKVVPLSRALDIRRDLANTSTSDIFILGTTWVWFWLLIEVEQSLFHFFCVFSLAAGCQFHHRWLPSEWNKADGPSRKWERETKVQAPPSKRGCQRTISEIIYPTDSTRQFEAVGKVKR